MPTAAASTAATAAASTQQEAAAAFIRSHMAAAAAGAGGAFKMPMTAEQKKKLLWGGAWALYMYTAPTSPTLGARMRCLLDDSPQRAPERWVRALVSPRATHAAIE